MMKRTRGSTRTLCALTAEFDEKSPFRHQATNHGQLKVDLDVDVDEGVVLVARQSTSASSNLSTVDEEAASQSDQKIDGDGDGDGNDEKSQTSASSVRKLKRFLKTIYDFSKSLPERRHEKVANLIVEVVNQQVDEQKFYDKLYDLTKFPLRPYVVPFMKRSLPLLRLECHNLDERAIHSSLFASNPTTAPPPPCAPVGRLHSTPKNCTMSGKEQAFSNYKGENISQMGSTAPYNFPPNMQISHQHQLQQQQAATSAGRRRMTFEHSPGNTLFRLGHLSTSAATPQLNPLTLSSALPMPQRPLPSYHHSNKSANNASAKNPGGRGSVSFAPGAKRPCVGGAGSSAATSPSHRLSLGGRYASFGGNNANFPALAVTSSSSSANSQHGGNYANAAAVAHAAFSAVAAAAAGGGGGQVDMAALGGSRRTPSMAALTSPTSMEAAVAAAAAGLLPSPGGFAPPPSLLTTGTSSASALPPMSSRQALAHDVTANGVGGNGAGGLGMEVDGLEAASAAADWWATSNEDWNNVESLFSTMITTMERIRYAMLLFQQRSKLAQLWGEKFHMQSRQRQQSSDQRIEEVKRKADAVVQEVKTAAVTELQKAVLASERKALQMIAMERSQMEKLMNDSHQQEDSPENCWNCGRRAGQTCSGCGRARYCTIFCQHKDWPRHRDDCTTATTSVAAKAPKRSTLTPMRGVVVIDDTSPIGGDVRAPASTPVDTNSPVKVAVPPASFSLALSPGITEASTAEKRLSVGLLTDRPRILSTDGMPPGRASPKSV